MLGMCINGKKIIGAVKNGSVIFRYYKYFEYSANNNAYAVVSDSKGNVYYGDGNGGVYKRDYLGNLKNTTTFSSTGITALALSPDEKTLLIGTYDGQLESVDSSSLNQINYENTDSNTAITAITIDKDEHLYFGFLYSSAPNVFKYDSYKNFYSSDWNALVRGGTGDIKIGSDSTVYIADQNGYIDKYTPQGLLISSFGVNGGAANKMVLSNGLIYIAANNVIACFDTSGNQKWSSPINSGLIGNGISMDNSQRLFAVLYSSDGDSYLAKYEASSGDTMGLTKINSTKGYDVSANNLIYVTCSFGIKAFQRNF